MPAFWFDMLPLAESLVSKADRRKVRKVGAHRPRVAITELPDDLLKDARWLLPILLPPGWQIARTEQERR